MRAIAVKNFERHQHYGDRRPPWIKLYNDLLDDYDFLALPERTQRHLMMIWLIASRHDNRIPDDLTYLTHAIHAKTRPDFASMFDSGFLVYVEHSASDALASPEHSASNGASKPLAKSPKNARPRARGRPSRETETETETETTPARNRAGKPSLFPKRLCDAMHTAWQDAMGAIDYGRFRKALKPICEPPPYPDAELVAAVTCFAEIRDARPMTEWHFWNPEKLAGSLREYVRLGRQPNQDPETGIPTERGRLTIMGHA